MEGRPGSPGRALSSATIKQVQRIISELSETFSTHHRPLPDECSSALEQMDEIDAFLKVHWVTFPTDYKNAGNINYINALVGSTRRLLQELRETCPPGDEDLREEICDLLMGTPTRVSAAW